ncbi:hypothetical protein EV361DRAFT_936203 [Lentinula raphanica]|nr:hypothetical protein EV361DRAFT_936203 [Lentinula raphanica]
MQRYNNNNKRPLRKRPIRDRTVTTLTGNDNKQEPPPPSSAISNNSISFNDEPQVFSPLNSTAAAANLGNLHFNQLEVPLAAMSPSFGFGFNSFVGPMKPNTLPGNSQQNSSSSYYNQPTPMLPPGKSDLEILENLKERIKKGQHEFFRATPMPELLAGLYLGPSSQDLDTQEKRSSDSNNDEGNSGKKTSSNATTAVASENLSSKIVYPPTSQDNNSKDNNSKSRMTSSTEGPRASINPSLPAKPALANGHSNLNTPKDEISSGRDTYLPPPRERGLSSSSASFHSTPTSDTVSANKYHDPRDTREPRDVRDRDRDNRDNREKGPNAHRRRSSSVSVSGAEYASVRYGPIRDIRDKDLRRDSRDLGRPADDHYDNASYRKEDVIPPPPLPVVDDYRRPSIPNPLPPSFNDRYSRPPPAAEERYRSEDRYPERLPPPPPPPPLSQPSGPPSSSYGAYRPDDRDRMRYDNHNNYSNHSTHPPNHTHHLHTGITPPARPNHAHASHPTGSRYNDNRPQIGESPVAAAALAEREQRERAAAEREQREKMERERERERMGQRDMRPPLPPSQAPVKLEERIASRAPTLQERLNHPPVVTDGARSLSLEERLSTHSSTGNIAITNSSVAPGLPGSPASAKAPSIAGSAATVPPTSASSTASTSAISGTTERLGLASGPAGASSAAPSAGTGPPVPRNYSPAPSHARDDSGGARERYPSPTPSERDRERDRRMRAYPSPPLYDRDRDRDRDRDHRRLSTGGNGGSGPVGGPGGREYFYDERDRDRDRRRDWPPPPSGGGDPYYRPPPANVSSRSTPSLYPSPPPHSSSQEPPSSVGDRYDRDARDARSGFRGSWDARDHDRRSSGPSSVLGNTSSRMDGPPPRGGGNNGGGGGIPIPIPIPIPLQNSSDDRDRSYRPSPGVDSRYPSFPPSSGSGTPASYNPSRVRPRSPSPGPRGPPVKRPRDDMYSPLPPSSSSASYSSPGYANGPTSGPGPLRRSMDYPPPPLPHAQSGREMRDPRDGPYYDKYDKYDPRSPNGGGGGGNVGGNYSSSIPASYDRPRSPLPPPRGGAYPGGFRDSTRDMRDMRDPRDGRDPRDPRDMRDMRDMRDQRDMRDMRDLRDDPRRYSMAPPPLPR